jgi:hypothetical protein
MGRISGSKDFITHVYLSFVQGVLPPLPGEEIQFATYWAGFLLLSNTVSGKKFALRG